MAPNKKKKKPASNPARGFATTSIASKPRIVDDVLDNDTILPNEALSLSDSGPSRSNADISQFSKESGKELHELSPEELETQLEESDLQLLLEKNGEKSKKEAFRQTSKLLTERRTLQPQAQHLNTRGWIPPEIMLQIVDLLHDQISDRDSNIYNEQRRSVPTVMEDELVIKTWTLKQVLIQLGFSEKRIKVAVCELLRKGHPVKPLNPNTSKDSVWGLEEVLDWLALVCEPEEMPDYEPSGSKNRGKRLKTVSESGLFVGADPQDSSPVLSEPSTPLPLPESNMDREPLGLPFENISNDTATESDDEIEPGKLVEKYISLKTRLHKLQPPLPAHGYQKREIKSATKSDHRHHEGATPEASKIIRKINGLNSDILFDRDEANKRWALVQNDLARNAAERRRFHLDAEVTSADVSKDHGLSESDTHSETASISALSGADPMDMVRDLFSTVSSTIDADTGTINITNSAPDGTAIIVRDFGKWGGLSPHRILEEACKARDPFCKITYDNISPSSFSHRESVSIVWSCSQDLPINSPLTAVSCKASQRFVRVAMSSISAATSVQAQAYVSTVALFLVFSSVPKEEKAYLRLPPTWRDLWAEFLRMRKEQIEVADREVLRELRSLVVQNNQAMENIAVPKSNGSNIKTSSNKTSNTQASLSLIQEPGDSSDHLKAVWSAKVSTPSYSRMLNARKDLPIWKFKDDLLAAIEKSQVVIICGETGCGKSTQVPAFIVGNELSNGRHCRVYCTEPRRISAISLARRVSEELGESKNDVGSSRSLVGYAIRLESHITNQTRLVYATTGIVMRMLERSDDLADITHLVLDEVHERSIDSDFLLIVLRKLMTRRPNLKVLLMSATVDAKRFSTYLDGAPIMTIPGRTFPVETRYLEDAIEASKFDDRDMSSHGPNAEDIDDIDDILIDHIGKQTSAIRLQGYSAKTRNTLAKLDEYRIGYDFIVKLLVTVATSPTYANYSKAVLVFLPGIAEIRRLNDMLLSHQTFSHQWRICALHSTISMEEQEQAFLVPPKGIRKIVLATNIAETGVTIPDVTCVIDTGKHKEMRFDERRQLSRLIESFISRANAKQRRGRAGRVQNGLCFHLFTRARHDNLMAEEQTPEMLRLSLQDLVLRVKICNLGGIEQTLSEALDPPSSKNIRRAIDSLVDVKALTATEDLTPLGRQLARLPLDVFLGKLVIVGSIFQTLDAALTIAAILSSKSPFSAPMGARSQADVARLAYKKGESDLLTVYNAYCAWRRVCGTDLSSEHQFCRKNYLSQQTLSSIEDLKGQLTASLADAGFLLLDGGEKVSVHNARTHSKWRRFVELPEKYDVNNSNELIVNSVIAWSFYPKLLKRDGKGWRNVANNQTVSLHPTSVNKGVERPPEWLSFYHIMQSSNKFYNAHETTSVEDFAIALVCGDADFKMYAGVIVIDGNRIRFRVDDWKTMLAIKALRTNIRLIMSQAFRNPGRQLTQQQQAWYDIWREIFRQAYKDKR